MEYIKVKVTVRNGDVDLLCDRLADIAPGFEIDDPAVIDDFVNDKNSRWDYIEEGLYENPKRDPSAVFYFEDNPQGSVLMNSAHDIVMQMNSGGEYVWESFMVKSSDWENNWKQYYKPFKIGEKLFVRPSWEAIDDCEGRIILVMDPASSFGTGSHATTRLCMEQLDGLDCVGKNILDMGCGSGILGCCAMLLGGKRIFSCDIEENAIKTTSENMDKNGIPAEKCASVCGDVLQNPYIRQKVAERGKYDIILSNIVADVLMGMSEYFAEWLEKDGKLILSGIINERADEVSSHFVSVGFMVERRLEREGWTMLLVSIKE
ncbi:MAG: 50S ribosomal protein L11 methyltransferase [Clostridiaceae bacterium]|nr:50S ribosomal protein L11 methyltransferase [Clostridiaceae bacterium]